jgi:hypothetical protein
MHHHQAPYRVAPAAVAPAAAAKARHDHRWEASMLASDSAPGYVTSSYDLRAGLDVRLVAVAQLPSDLLREFQRLRQCWGPEEALA